MTDKPEFGFFEQKVCEVVDSDDDDDDGEFILFRHR